MKKKHIEKLIAQGDLQTALEQIRNCSLNADQSAMLKTLEHNFFKARQQFAQQQIPYKEFERTTALVATGLTQILENVTEKPPGLFMRYIKWFAAAAIILLVTFVVAYTLRKPGNKPNTDDTIQMSSQGKQSPVIKGDNTRVEYNNNDKESQ